MDSKSVSPLTGLPAEKFEASNFNDVTIYEEEIGRWASAGVVRRDGFRRDRNYQSPSLNLDVRQTRRLLAYTASVVWQATKLGTKPLAIASQEAVMEGQAQIELHWKQWRVVSPEQLWAEVATLTFEEQALQTLLNLTLVEASIGSGVLLLVKIEHYPGSFGTLEEPKAETVEGLVFAAIDKEAMFILRHLIERGFVVKGAVSERGSGTTFYITPAGYAAASQIQSGRRSEIRKAFLICRFDDKMERVTQEIYRPAGDHPDVRCRVERVKDVHHVEQITDKIVSMIDEATIVIVDLTSDEVNFNVAFEAGYALARGKPIVWMKEWDGDDFRPPFDIQSQNIFRWKADEPEAFAESVRLRMIAALDKAATVRLAF